MVWVYLFGFCAVFNFVVMLIPPVFHWASFLNLIAGLYCAWKAVDLYRERKLSC